MALTIQQQATLKSFVLADPVLNQIPHTNDGAFAIADALNATDPDGYQVWRTSTNADTILDAITWANLTPTGASDGSAIAMQNEYKCQGRQLNLQIMLQGRDTLGTGKASIRQGLADALTNVPAGAGNLLEWGPLNALQSVLNGQAAPSVAAGALVLTDGN